MVHYMVSVIVPVFMVENYLSRCIESVLAQSYTNYELILVDDGSPDKCGEICDSYAVTDKRIRVIHQENGGLSDARNTGLSISSGEYVAFIDSDDWIHPDFLKVLVNIIENNCSDIVECEKLLVKDEETNEYLFKEGINQEALNSIGSHVYGAEEALKLLIEDNLFHQHVWNKLYRRSLLERLHFPAGKLHEDEFWTYKVFGRASTITKIDIPLYYYFQRNTSIMGNRYSYRRLESLEAKWKRQKYIDFYFPNLSNWALSNLYASLIYAGQCSLKYLRGNERKRAINKINLFRKHIDLSIDVYKKSDPHQRIWFILSKFSFWGTCVLKNCLNKGL